MLRQLLLALAATIALLLPTAADEWSDALDALNAEDFATALALMTPLAEAGHMEAQDKLSHIYWYGDGVPVDYELALGWTQRALQQGSAVAMYNLSVHYSEGKAVPYDEVIARDWLEKAAALDHPGAHLGLFQMKWFGLGGEKDEVAARNHLEQAAAHALPKALLVLGLSHLQGSHGFKLDKDVGQQLLMQAAESRLTTALTTAGSILGLSALSTGDYLEPVTYLRAALADGCVDVLPQLMLLMSAMPIEQLQKSDATLGTWLAEHPRPEAHTHQAHGGACQIWFMPQVEAPENAGTPA